MILVADSSHFDHCVKILSERDGKAATPAFDSFYLDKNDQGFTLLVMDRDENPIAISTFTKRRSESDGSDKKLNLLYWENLYVSESARDGLAYIQMFGWVRRLVRRGEFDDIYFIVHRPQAKQIHMTAGFSSVRQFRIAANNLKLNLVPSSGTSADNVSTIPFGDVRSYLGEQHSSQDSLDPSRIAGCTTWDQQSFLRQIENKEGVIILPGDSEPVAVVRIRKIFPFVYLVVPLAGKPQFRNWRSFRQHVPKGIVIFSDIYEQTGNQRSRAAIREYELLSLTKKINPDRFQLLEHDAI